MLSVIRQLLRLAAIAQVLARHGFEQVVVSLRLLGPYRFLLLLQPGRKRRRDSAPAGARLRAALEDLGPIFVKFGQTLSTRPDLLPDDIAKELARLQDRVPPFPGDQARAILERAYRRPLGEVFAEFDETPLAAASISQVHAATLHSGHKVVVKVLRPGIEKTIHSDVQVLQTLALLAKKYLPEARRLRPVEVVNEYRKTILNELDLMREAGNAAQLRRNFEDSEQLYIPEVFFEYCRNNVMVMERIHGLPVNDIASLRDVDANLEQLARYGVEIFFTQVFRHNFFHADMHPGNIFVNATEPANPTYIAVDFGIVGTLTAEDQHYLAANLLAFFKRDYRRVAQLHVESGWVPPGTRVDELETAVRTVCEPVFNKPLKEISFGMFLLRLFQTARQFDMEIQPQLVLLQKTLLNIEGLGRQLYPDLDLWVTAKPFLEEWMAERLSGREAIEKLRAHLPQLREDVQSLPSLALEALHQLSRGDFRLRLDSEPMQQLQHAMRENARWRHGVYVGAALLVAGSLLIGLDGGAQPPWLGWGMTGLGLALMLISRPG
ncbi:MAG: ubiquinone biosynthesis regulatory protein kinase UbiB [Pseudomonadota bacterium]